MVKRRIVAGVVAGGLVVGAAGCGGSGSSGEAGDDVYDVLLIGAKSGIYQTIGAPCIQGHVASAAVVNDAGGIGGRKVKLVVEDDKSTPDAAVVAAQEALASSNPPDLIVSCQTYAAAAVGPIVERSDALFASGVAIDPFIDAEKYPRMVFTVPHDEPSHRLILERFKQQGISKVGVLTTTTDYGTTTEKYIDELGPDVGVETELIKVDAAAVDFTAQLQKLQAAGVEGLYLTNPAVNVATMLKNRAKLGWQAPVILGVVPGAGNIHSLVSAAELKGVEGIQLKNGVDLPDSDKSVAYPTFIDAVEAEGAPDQSITLYGYAYDLLQIVAAAADVAGSTDPDKVAAGLADIPEDAAVTWVTLTEPLGMTDELHVPVPASDEYVFSKPGPLTNGVMKRSE